MDFVGGRVGERKDGTGGWHDAGDYNKYTVNGAFTAGNDAQARGKTSRKAGAAYVSIFRNRAIPTPDFLDEVRWELDWLLKMQDGDGSVYHKVSALKFCGFILPDKETAKGDISAPGDRRPPPSFAAVMAAGLRGSIDLSIPPLASDAWRPPGKVMTSCSLTPKIIIPI